MKKIGLTRTVLVEVLLAVGYMSLDLNNIFITDGSYLKYIDIAEKGGFPKSTCAIYRIKCERICLTCCLILF